MSYYRQNLIAVIWDFDKTLIPGYMQEPLFEQYDIVGSQFWLEVNGLAASYAEKGIRVAPGSAYLNHLLTYVTEGKMAGLSNERLREAGSKLKFYNGVPDVFDRLCDVVRRDPYSKHDIAVEHYIVSTGLRRMIEGSAVGPKVRGIWASEFIDSRVRPGGQFEMSGADPAITQVGYVVDDTTKTRALFEINKGVNDDPRLDINGLMPDSERRIPFPQMICVADGPSDVPMFSVVKQYGGLGFAVYDPKSPRHFEQVALLQEQGRVLATFPADYAAGTPAAFWLERAVLRAADTIVRRQEAVLAGLTVPPPSHVVEEPVSLEVRTVPTSRGRDGVSPAGTPAAAPSPN